MLRRRGPVEAATPASPRAVYPRRPGLRLGLVGRKRHAPVVVKAEARVVRDLPGVAVGVAERAGVAAVEGFRRLSGDLGPVASGPLDDLVDLLAQGDVVREGDAAPATAVVGNAHVGGELGAAPQHHDDAVRLEEARLLGLPGDRPPERRVEALRSLVVGDAESDEADALPQRLLRAGGVLAAAVLLALAKEARQLGCERIA